MSDLERQTSCVLSLIFRTLSRMTRKYNGNYLGRERKQQVGWDRVNVIMGRVNVIRVHNIHMQTVILKPINLYRREDLENESTEQETD